MHTVPPASDVSSGSRGWLPERARERIARRLIGPLREALTVMVGRPVDVKVVLDDERGER